MAMIKMYGNEVHVESGLSNKRKKKTLYITIHAPEILGATKKYLGAILNWRP